MKKKKSKKTQTRRKSANRIPKARKKAKRKRKSRWQLLYERECDRNLRLGVLLNEQRADTDLRNANRYQIFQRFAEEMRRNERDVARPVLSARTT